MKKTAQRSEYVFKKKEKVFNVVDNILRELGFKERPEHCLKDLICEEKGSGPKTKIKDLIDESYNIKNKTYNVEIFFGKNKVILVILSKTDKQQKISNIVFKFASFKEQ